MEAKHNLVRRVEDLTPVSLRQRVKGSSDPEAVWGKASLRQVSLLRASMRADLAIYSSPASPTGRGPELGKEDREFLVASKVNLNRQPWRPPFRTRLLLSLRPTALPEDQEPRQHDA